MAPAPISENQIISDLDAQDQEETNRLDSIFDRIRSKTPAQPYIVSVPSLFQYHPMKESYDFRDSHWDHSERHLEYSSYLYRDTASGDTLFQLEVQDLGQDTPMQNTPRVESNANTNPNTPSLGPKKKVSLADYKKRAREKAQGSSVQSAGGSDTGTPSNSKISTTDTSALSSQEQPTPGEKLVTPQSRSTSAVSQPREKPHTVSKAAASASVSGTKAEELEAYLDKPVRPPTSHPRVSQEASPTMASHTTASGRHSISTSSTPASLRNSAALSKKAKEVPKIKVDRSESPLPGRLTPMTVLEDSPSPTSLRLSAATGVPRDTTEVFLDLPSDMAFEKARKTLQDPKSRGKDELTKSTPTKRAKPEDKPSEDGKARPLSAATSSRSATTVQSKQTKRSVDAELTPSKAAAKTTDAAKLSEKRMRDVPAGTDESHSTKRAKTSETLHQSPRTPPNAEASSPKSKLLLTPAKSLRRGGDDSSKANTPKGHVEMPTPETLSSSPSQRWKRELARLESIGKKLKRESQSTASSSEAAKDRGSKERNLKLSIVQGVESILCFMTAFCANDQLRATHVSWRSLAVLLEEVTKRAEGKSHIQGLCFLLRACCCFRSVSILNNFKVDELREPEKIKEHIVAVQTYVQRADRFARDANERLTRQVLAKTYPEACKASNAIPLATPAPMATVRMAMSFLGEWSKQHGLEWTPSFEEGECSKL